MFSLIVSYDGHDEVYIASTRKKLENKAVSIIQEELETMNGFGSLEVEQLLLESLKVNDADSSMELFADISDARGNMTYMRISSAEIEMDA